MVKVTKTEYLYHNVVINIMTFSDRIFHNIYLLENIFSYAQFYNQYRGIELGDEIVYKGLLKLLQLKTTHENNLCFSYNLFDLMARDGHLDSIKWLHDNNIQGCTTWAMDWAAAGGHLHVVRWLHRNRSEGCTPRAMNSAAMNGHLHVVQWLHVNRTEGCTSSSIVWAAGNGHLDIVNWLYENRREAYNINCIAESKQLKVRDWLNVRNKNITNKIYFLALIFLLLALINLYNDMVSGIAPLTLQ